MEEGGEGGGEGEKESLVVFLLSPRFALSDITISLIPDARRPEVFSLGLFHLALHFIYVVSRCVLCC